MIRRTTTILVCTLSLINGLRTVANADDKSAGDASYFLGESKMKTPDGKVIRTTVSLVKRVVNQADSKIEEHVMTISESDVKAFVVTMQVSGNKVTLTEKSNSFTGEGELIGEPWKWKEWKTVSKLPGGAGTVISEDKWTDQSLTAKKSFSRPDGKVLFQFEENLNPITAKTYDILYKQLSAKEKK